MFVVLLWPDFVASGPVVPAVPDGVFDDGVPPVPAAGESAGGIVLVVPAVVSAVPVPDVEPLLIEPDDDGDGDDVDDDVSLPVGAVGLPEPPAVDVLPVVEVDDGLDIELSVFGVSVLLQAPRAARVAAIATHLIELRMFAPRVGGVPEGCPPPSPARVG